MNQKPLAPIADDTEESRWLGMSMPEWSTVFNFYNALQSEWLCRDTHPLLAVRLPIRYQLEPGGRVEQLAPDALVAHVDVYDRMSYDVDLEGAPPDFVLEVVSVKTLVRDLRKKRERYERIGIKEYALFAPVTPHGWQLLRPALQGYRLDPESKTYARWEADHNGRLYSEVLQLWLAVRDEELRVQRPDGSWPRTPAESRRDREAATQALEAATPAPRAGAKTLEKVQARLVLLESESDRLQREIAQRDKR